MAALEKSEAQRFAVISDDEPHLSARRQAAWVRCPETGLILLFTDVMNVENLRRAEARFACTACGETHDVPSGGCGFH
jgi:hypothetical protein